MADMLLWGMLAWSEPGSCVLGLVYLWLLQMEGHVADMLPTAKIACVLPLHISGPCPYVAVVTGLRACAAKLPAQMTAKQFHGCGQPSSQEEGVSEGQQPTGTRPLDEEVYLIICQW